MSAAMRGREPLPIQHVTLMPWRILFVQVADAGSLNGTLLNGTRISVAGRRRGAAYRLNSDDLLQLGTSTAIKVPSWGALKRSPKNCLPYCAGRWSQTRRCTGNGSCWALAHADTARRAHGSADPTSF